MKKFIFFLIITPCFIACNAQKSTEQLKCEEAVIARFADWGDIYHPVSFSDFEKADISIDSLRNTYLLGIRYSYLQMHHKFIQELEEKLSTCDDCDEKSKWESNLELQKELLAKTEEEIQDMEGLYTPKNYVIEHAYLDGGESRTFRYYLNDNYQIMSHTMLESNGENFEHFLDQFKNL